MSFNPLLLKNRWMINTSQESIWSAQCYHITILLLIYCEIIIFSAYVYVSLCLCASQWCWYELKESYQFNLHIHKQILLKGTLSRQYKILRHQRSPLNNMNLIANVYMDEACRRATEEAVIMLLQLKWKVLQLLALSLSLSLCLSLSLSLSCHGFV